MPVSKESLDSVPETAKNVKVLRRFFVRSGQGVYGANLRYVDGRRGLFRVSSGRLGALQKGMNDRGSNRLLTQ